jgi:hypothetical protein
MGPSEIDRGCPLETGIDPPMWHVNGTTGEGPPQASAKGGLVLLVMVELVGRRNVEQARHDEALGHRPRSVRPG